MNVFSSSSHLSDYSTCAGFGWNSFFTVATTGCWFGFVLQAVLIVHGVFIIAEQRIHSQGLFCTTHQWAGRGCTRIWEATEPGQMTPSDLRDIPSHMTSCSAHRAGGQRRKAGKIWRDGVCFPKPPLHVMEPGCSGNGWTLPALGKWWRNSLLGLCLFGFALPITPYLSWSIYSLWFFHFSSPSHGQEVNKCMCGSHLTGRTKPWHYLNLFTLV